MLDNNITLILVALVAACAPTIAAIAAVIQAMKTHKAVNSRMDELLSLAKTSSKAEGVLEEKERSL